MNSRAFAKLALLLRLRAAANLSKLRIGPHSSDRKILFVLGTGRSGTHFLTRCLISHPGLTDLNGGEENPLVFSTITSAALDQARSEALLAKAQDIYDGLAAYAHPRWLVDQSHPNIWFADRWAQTYPSAHLVGIIRNPFSVVASMMKHPGVRAWALQWEDYPLPNPFLGITDAEAYRRMSLAERCTMRWISHYRRMGELELTLGSRLSVVIYEELCDDPEGSISKITDQLGLDGDSHLPRVDGAALTRGAQMEPSDAAAIERLLMRENIDPRWTRPPW